MKIPAIEGPRATLHAPVNVARSTIYKRKNEHNVSTVDFQENGTIKRVIKKEPLCFGKYRSLTMA